MSNILFYQPSMIVDGINAANGLTIVPADVILEISSNSENDWLVEQGHGDTVVRVVATKTGSFEGETLVAYDRVQIQMIHNMVGGFCGIPQSVKTVHDALPYFAARFGIVFYAEDIKDGAVTWTEAGATFTLEAEETSLLYQGSAAFISSFLPDELANIIVDTDLPTYPVYAVPTDKYFAEGLVYGVNFSNAEPLLSVMTPEAYTPESILTILNENTSIVWKVEDDVDAIGSLHNSAITYNGLNNGIELANTDFKYVMLIELRDDSNVVKGTLIMHYNDASNYDSLPV